jgi:AcrR family transcriptional regulator
MAGQELEGATGDGGFRTLRPGRGLSREFVQAHQRTRIESAVAQAVSERGYRALTVGDVLRVAHVSRGAFYAQFENKEDCFVATYARTLSEVVATLEREFRAAGDPERGIAAALGKVVARVSEAPAAARLALVEALGAGNRAVAERESANATLERMLLAALACAAPNGRVTATTAKAVVGGIAMMLQARVRADELDELSALVPEWTAWALSYAASSPPEWMIEPDAAPVVGHHLAERPIAPLERFPAGLPAGPHGLSRDYVAQNQRERIVHALTRLAAEQGFGAVTLRDIASTAGISLGTFYEHFHNKEDGFLAAQQAGNSTVLEPTTEAFLAHVDKDWPEAVRAGLTVFTECLSGQPELARIGFIEVHAAGDRALADSEVLRQGFTYFLAPGLEQSGAKRRTIPPHVPELIAGGISEVIYSAVVSGRTHELPALAPELTRIALVPFIGAAAADRAVSKAIAR